MPITDRAMFRGGVIAWIAGVAFIVLPLIAVALQ